MFAMLACVDLQEQESFVEASEVNVNECFADVGKSLENKEMQRLLTAVQRRSGL